jgi:predicted secreted protein
MRSRFLQAVSIALLMMASGVARAGDGSALNIIGFSPDGRYFAFEQFGEQDGAGSLYASITAVEVAGDRVVKGTPVTSSIDPEAADRRKEPREKLLAEVRANVAREAAALLKMLRISETGRPIAFVPKSRSRDMLDSEPVKAARQSVARTVALPQEYFGPDAQLVLREFDIALPRCKDLVVEGHPNGFALTLERKGRPTIHLSRDQTIPVARGCPDRYGIAEAHALRLADDSIAFAVIIQYFYFAFEGPDRRFLAITGRVK